jgi:hypothetical protein
MSGQKKPAPKPHKDVIEQEYMASPYLDWAAFAKSKNWDVHATRVKYPTGVWRAEKEKILGTKRAETLAAVLFQHNHRWHSDVLKTLREYPKMADKVADLLIRKITYLSNLDEEKFNEGDVKVVGDKPVFIKPVSSWELMALAQALKATTEAKHKSLLLDQWTAEKARDAARPPEPKDVTETGGMVFEVIGKGQLGTRDIQSFMDEYLDKPKAKNED